MSLTLMQVRPPSKYARYIPYTSARSFFDGTQEMQSGTSAHKQLASSTLLLSLCSRTCINQSGVIKPILAHVWSVYARVYQSENSTTAQ